LDPDFGFPYFLARAGCTYIWHLASGSINPDILMKRLLSISAAMLASREVE
jgi:hypothetical protein